MGWMAWVLQHKQDQQGVGAAEGKPAHPANLLTQRDGLPIRPQHKRNVALSHHHLQGRVMKNAAPSFECTSHRLAWRCRQEQGQAAQCTAIVRLQSSRTICLVSSDSGLTCSQPCVLAARSWAAQGASPGTRAAASAAAPSSAGCSAASPPMLSSDLLDGPPPRGW